MNKILVKSVHDAFEYVMDHYYPEGCEDYAILSDTYAVISIQDAHIDGFGIKFDKNKFCKDVLTLYFDDVYKEVKGATLFDEEMARKILRFVKKNKNVDTLLIHCYAGQSRSLAVGVFLEEKMGIKIEECYSRLNPNPIVLEVMEKVY